MFNSSEIKIQNENIHDRARPQVGAQERLDAEKENRRRA
jgi:hypothetical protein